LGFIISQFHVGNKEFGDRSAPEFKQKNTSQHLRSKREWNTQEAGKIGCENIEVTGVNRC
jgi:hypothetical protein